MLFCICICQGRSVHRYDGWIERDGRTDGWIGCLPEMSIFCTGPVHSPFGLNRRNFTWSRFSAQRSSLKYADFKRAKSLKPQLQCSRAARASLPAYYCPGCMLGLGSSIRLPRRHRRRTQCRAASARESQWTRALAGSRTAPAPGAVHSFKAEQKLL